MSNFNFTEGSGKTGAAVDIGGGVLAPQVIATEHDGSDTALAAKLGSLTETAPATDTASSGINGRLQRIAQRLTTLIGSTIAVSGTFWQATQPISASSLPLPTGAATESTLGGVLTTSDFDAKAGSLTETAPTTDTASSGLNGRLQRIAQRLTSLIALLPTALGAGGGMKVDGSGTALPVSGTVTANAGTNLNTSTLAVETGGNLATIAGAVSSSKMATKAASGDFADGALATIGAKADAKNTATDTTAVSGISIWKQISASVQAIATSVAGTLTVATHAVTQSGTWNVTVNAAIAAGTNLLGKVGFDQTTPGTTNAVSLSQLGANTIATGNGTSSTGTLRVAIASDNTSNTNPFLTTSAPATSGGLSVYHLASANSTNATNVKASAGQLYGYMISNTSAAYSYVAFHNASGTPTAGASILFKLGIPAGGAANVEFSNGIAFSTGIAISTVTGAADSNSTAVAANDLIINLFYK